MLELIVFIAFIIGFGFLMCNMLGDIEGFMFGSFVGIFAWVFCLVIASVFSGEAVKTESVFYTTTLESEEYSRIVLYEEPNEIFNETSIVYEVASYQYDEDYFLNRFFPTDNSDIVIKHVSVSK